MKPSPTVAEQCRKSLHGEIQHTDSLVSGEPYPISIAMIGIDVTCPKKMFAVMLLTHLYYIANNAHISYSIYSEMSNQ